MTKMRVAAAAAAAVAALGLGVGAAGTASALPPPLNCQNNGGNQPPGQQDTCNGNGLDVVNPAGHAPGGFNK